MTMWLTEGILDGSVQARQPQTQQGKARAHGPIRKKPMWINVFELPRKKNVLGCLTILGVGTSKFGDPWCT